MKTYHCHRCDAKKELDPKKWGRSNLESYCFCNPDVGFLMSPTSRKALEKKYGKIFSVEKSGVEYPRGLFQKHFPAKV